MPHYIGPTLDGLTLLLALGVVALAWAVCRELAR
jgi:hypothetical protein